MELRLRVAASVLINGKALMLPRVVDVEPVEDGLYKYIVKQGEFKGEVVYLDDTMIDNNPEETQ